MSLTTSAALWLTSSAGCPDATTTKILSVCIPTAFALNHLKFYRFAAQFVRGKRVGDFGCGSGYGCKIFSDEGAVAVRGADASKEAIDFARQRYSSVADFTVQSITALDASRMIRST